MSASMLARASAKVSGTPGSSAIISVRLSNQASGGIRYEAGSA